MISGSNRKLLIWVGHAAWILWTIALVLTLAGLDTAFLIIVILGGIAGAVTWIAALIIAAQRQQWGWVVGIAIVNYIGGYVYLLTHTDENV